VFFLFAKLCSRLGVFLTIEAIFYALGVFL